MRKDAGWSAEKWGGGEGRREGRERRIEER